MRCSRSSFGLLIAGLEIATTGWGQSGFAQALGKWNRNGESTRKLDLLPLTEYCLTLRILTDCLNLLTDLTPGPSLSEPKCTLFRVALQDALGAGEIVERNDYEG